jgi:hypothetical protein
MNLSLKQYRAVDLTIFLVLTVAFDAIGIVAINSWFSGGVYFSVSLLFTLLPLVLMRWGGYAVIHAAAAGATFCLAFSLSSGGGVMWQDYLIYIVGNSFSLLVLLLNRFVGKEKIRGNAWLSIAYVVLVYILVELGRSLMAMFMLQPFSTIIVSFLRADALSTVFAVIVILVARRQNGLFEDQIHYLQRLADERAEERRLKDEGLS